MKYLSPKNDMVFKKIFGQHPDLLKSFLNAVLPLSDDQKIETLEYLPVEQIPDIPILKRTIVDVKCRDRMGRIFVVEMQMAWTEFFMQRLLFGAAQAYVKQLEPGKTYNLLHPVYGLGILDAVFDKQSDEWYHHYGLVKLNNPQQEIIRGLTLVFVELPKFVPTSMHDKRLQVLWFRFMREINEKTRKADPELEAVPEIAKALHLAEQASFSLGELQAYEDYWNVISTERTFHEERFEQGIEKGIEEGIERGIEKGIEKGIEQGIQQGIRQEKKDIARAMKAAHVSDHKISKFTSLSLEEIKNL